MKKILKTGLVFGILLGGVSTLKAQIYHNSNSNSSTGSALGKYCNSTGLYSFGSGYDADATGHYSIALGVRNRSTNSHATTIGIDLQANKNRSMTIGSGTSTGADLVNNISNSLMVGFNSTIPTLFVGRAAGAGTVGRVGIGTSAPAAGLHISNNEPVSLLVQTKGNNNADIVLQSGNNQADIAIKSNTGSLLSLMRFNKDAYGPTFSFQDRTGGSNAVTVPFHINGKGNVGIGTMTPNARLHVKDDGTIALDAHLEGFTLIDGAGASLLFGSTTNAPHGEWGIEYNSSGAHKGLNFWKPNGSNGFGNYFMFMKDNGNIGIGTNNPHGYKLAVNGDMIAESVTVKLYTEWPDYVFTKNYGLMDLEEVESFIGENSHLPNVPSAQEVEEEGINLGDMDAILLQKIEELTLYVIDLKKENKKQQATIDELIKK